MTAALLSAADIKALYAQGLALVQSGHPDQALPLFGRIIDANPTVAEARWQAAQILADDDQFPRALENAAAAAQLRPAEPAVWITWADITALDGRRASEKAFLEALKGAGMAEGGIRATAYLWVHRRD